jgi:hypothetical protein
MLHDVSLQYFILISPNYIAIEDKTNFTYTRFIIMLFKNTSFTEVF